MIFQMYFGATRLKIRQAKRMAGPVHSNCPLWPCRTDQRRLDRDLLHHALDLLGRLRPRLLHRSRHIPARSERRGAAERSQKQKRQCQNNHFSVFQEISTSLKWGCRPLRSGIRCKSLITGARQGLAGGIDMGDPAGGRHDPLPVVDAACIRRVDKLRAAGEL